MERPSARGKLSEPMPTPESESARPRQVRDGPAEEAAIAAAAGGDLAPLGELLETYRPRLERILRTRLDPRLTRRLDIADVVQDTYLEVTTRLSDYLAERAADASRAMPLFLWVRFLTGQRTQQLHRHHLGVAARDALREQVAAGFPAATSQHFAAVLEGKLTTPTQSLAREEQRAQLARALEALSTSDREILLLRHFEQLSNVEIATLLDMTEAGASIRHLRALQRLQAIFGRLGFEFVAPKP